MKYTQDNGKIKLCETDNMDHLVRLTQALNENNILYETRLKKGTLPNYKDYGNVPFLLPSIRQKGPVDLF